MKKIKLLYDGTLFVLKGRTGLYRVADYLLRYFAASDLFDVTLINSTRSPMPYAYLDKIGHPELKSKCLSMPLLKEMMETGAFAPKPTKEIRRAKQAYRKEMEKYDAYFSAFFPVPKVAIKAGLLSCLYVHDLIPVYHPEYTTDPIFHQRFSTWMRDNQSDFVAVNSVWTESQYLRFRPDYPKENILLSYLAADERFVPQPLSQKQALLKKYKIPNQKYFLSLCEITLRKNLSHLIRSFIRFLKETGADDVCLVLTGPARSENEEVFKTIASYQKYKHKIIQTGFVDDADLPALYSGALGFAYVSLEEGFGLPILEAMSCGTPVISADNTSLPEVGGDAVIYVSGHDEAQTKEALFSLYRDIHYRQALREKGLARAPVFSWKEVSGKIMGKFLSMMAERPLK